MTWTCDILISRRHAGLTAAAAFGSARVQMWSASTRRTPVTMGWQQGADMRSTCDVAAGSPRASRRAGENIGRICRIFAHPAGHGGIIDAGQGWRRPLTVAI